MIEGKKVSVVSVMLSRTSDKIVRLTEGLFSESFLY